MPIFLPVNGEQATVATECRCARVEWGGVAVGVLARARASEAPRRSAVANGGHTARIRSTSTITSSRANERASRRAGHALCTADDAKLTRAACARWRPSSPESAAAAAAATAAAAAAAAATRVLHVAAVAAVDLSYQRGGRRHRRGVIAVARHCPSPSTSSPPPPGRNSGGDPRRRQNAQNKNAIERADGAHKCGGHTRATRRKTIAARKSSLTRTSD